MVFVFVKNSTISSSKSVDQLVEFWGPGLKEINPVALYISKKRQAGVGIGKRPRKAANQKPRAYRPGTGFFIPNTLYPEIKNDK